MSVRGHGDGNFLQTVPLDVVVAMVIELLYFQLYQWHRDNRFAHSFYLLVQVTELDGGDSISESVKSHICEARHGAGNPCPAQVPPDGTGPWNVVFMKTG